MKKIGFCFLSETDFLFVGLIHGSDHLRRGCFGETTSFLLFFYALFLRERLRIAKIKQIAAAASK